MGNWIVIYQLRDESLPHIYEVKKVTLKDMESSAKTAIKEFKDSFREQINALL